jgi:hypothetical protein
MRNVMKSQSFKVYLRINRIVAIPAEFSNAPYDKNSALSESGHVSVLPCDGYPNGMNNTISRGATVIVCSRLPASCCLFAQWRGLFNHRPPAGLREVF